MTDQTARKLNQLTFRELKNWLDQLPEWYLDEPIEARAEYDVKGERLDRDTIIEVHDAQRTKNQLLLIGKEICN